VLVDSGNPRKLPLFIASTVDGRDDSGEALHIGIYIIFLEAINESSGVVETMKTVVVVARKL
jgi:hypothetical protein